MADLSTTRPGALVAPALGRHHVCRRRIDDALDAAIEAPLVLVSAPAGSGKTVAISGWLARRGAGAWYSLEAEDNDPAVFWPSVAAALRLEDVEAPDPRTVAGALFDTASAPAVLVLDDYHVMTNPAIHAGVDQLLSESPAALRLVIASRHDPPLTLSRLRTQRSLRELRFDDLRFDDDDVDAVLRETGVTLPQDHLRQVVERTDGWPAAVQLVGLSLRGEDDPSGIVDAFSGDHRHVADYLRDEVIARLPDRLRRFLHATAILDHLTAPLCEAVAGVDDAQELLEELERQNLFVLSLDHRRQWFRYHHLFAEWLRLQIGDDTSAHRAAAEWLLANGHTGDAVRHLIAAGEADRAADAIEEERWVLVGKGREETLRDWVQQLPAEVRRRRPGLTLAAAWVAHHAGRWNDVHELAASVQPDEDLGRAEGLLLEAGRLVAVGEFVAALDTARAGLDLAPPDDPRARTGLLLVQGRSLLSAGDLDGAATSFAEAAALASPYDITIVTLIARSHLAEIHRRAGRREEAMDAAREALHLAEAEGLAGHPEAAVANLTLADLLVDEGRLEEAASHVARGTELAGRVPYEPRDRQARAVRQRLENAAPLPRGGMIEQLTGRETSVLRLLPSSLTAREIAGELYLSLNTIKTHTRSIYRKLGVRTRHEAIEEARRQNLI